MIETIILIALFAGMAFMAGTEAEWCKHRDRCHCDICKKWRMRKTDEEELFF